MTNFGKIFTAHLFSNTNILESVTKMSETKWSKIQNLKRQQNRVLVTSLTPESFHPTNRGTDTERYQKLVQLQPSPMLMFLLHQKGTIGATTKLLTNYCINILRQLTFNRVVVHFFHKVQIISNKRYTTKGTTYLSCFSYSFKCFNPFCCQCSMGFSYVSFSLRSLGPLERCGPQSKFIKWKQIFWGFWFRFQPKTARKISNTNSLQSFSQENNHSRPVRNSKKSSVIW